MKIEKVGIISGQNLGTEDLLNYLSQVVLSKTDRLIELKQKELEKSKNQLSISRSSLEELKRKLSQESSKYSTAKALKRILSLIDTLERKGVLVGKNRARIAKLLYSINEMNFSGLRSLEERLSLYLPDY